MPRFDSEPVFASLLDEQDGGEFSIGTVDGSLGVQRYIDNTNVLETVFTTPEGSFRVLDFAPRNGHGMASDDVRGTLERAGFAQVRLESSGARWYLVIAVKPAS